jgi:hypothetical protein
MRHQTADVSIKPKMTESEDDALAYQMRAADPGDFLHSPGAASGRRG